MSKAKTLLASCTLFVSLAVATWQPLRADDQQIEFLDTMDRYLNIADHYVALASRRDAAIYFAVEGIAEIYENKGEKAQAIPHLERLLKSHQGNPTAANIIRFKLRDLYRETGQAQKALDQLDAVMAQNRGAGIDHSIPRPRNGG